MLVIKLAPGQWHSLLTRSRVIERFGGCSSGCSFSHSINQKSSSNIVTKVNTSSFYFACLQLLK
ncbi:MAG: hypothetical protein IJJ82_02530 [Clostridia bacterium]|nr:hypothetical protein [Clostridia bacterium]